MNWDDYQLAAMRTKADQQLILDRLCRLGSPAMQLDNAVTGLSDEVGELNAAKKKWIEYGQELDRLNVKEEVGDCLWRLAQICDALDLSLQECAEGNINKLKKRYPEKYTDLLAAEANRNREVEREALVQNGNGWAEPPEEKEKTKSQPENVTTILKELFMWVTKDSDGTYLFVSTKNEPPTLSEEKFFLFGTDYDAEYHDFFWIGEVAEANYPDIGECEIKQVKLALVWVNPKNFVPPLLVEKSDTGSFSLNLVSDYDVIISEQGLTFRELHNQDIEVGKKVAVRLVAINEGE